MPTVMRFGPLVLLLVCFSLAFAQGDAAVGRLEQAVQTARDSGQLRHPDQALWRQAILLAEQLTAEQPQSAELARLQAEIYSEVSWYARAYDAWLNFSELSGANPAPLAFAEAAQQLGFARYSAGDAAGALSHYGTLLGFQPDNAEALFWIGRIQLEQGEGAEAAASFSQLLSLQDTSSLSPSQLQLASNVETYGPEAALAFARGSSLFDAGQHAAALAEFEAAFAADRSFAQAAVWAGRTALELEDPELAAVYWGWAVELDPDDSRNRYFLELAERQAAWGIPAVASFDAGQDSYAAGDLPLALEQFEEAARLAPGYLEALSWSARVAQELERHALAADYWERVLAVSPADEGARYFLRLAEQRLAFGAEVSEMFLQGVGHYQAANFAAAEAAFAAVTQEDPQFAPAWGYLGQIHFAQRDYAQAAEAYETARSLEPGNDEYTFFAMEARRLAGSQD